MPRAPDPLQEARDRAGRADLADQVDVADVDAELERGGRDQRLQLTPLEALLGLQAVLPGEAAVVRAHQAFVEALGQLAGDPLGQPARVDENERGGVRLDQLGEAVVDLPPDVARHHRFERRRRDLDGEVARAPVADVDDRALGARRAIRTGPDQKARGLLDRLLGGREADPQQAIAAQRREALERQRQMGAALVRGERVDLVDDHGPRGGEHAAAGLRAEQDVEGLGRGDDDVRRRAAHALALAGRGIAGPHPGADLHVRQALRAQGVADAGKRRFQVTLDVVRERLQRRDVDDLRLVPELAGEALAQQRVDRREKGGERLARPRRRRDQGMAAGLDRRPRLRLRRRRRAEASIEPGGDRRVKQRRWVHDSTGVVSGKFPDGHSRRRSRCASRRTRSRLPQFRDDENWGSTPCGSTLAARSASAAG